MIGYNARQCTHQTIIAYSRPDSMMVGKDGKPTFHASRHMTATTFLMIGIIIITGTLSVFTLVLNQNHTAMGQQQQSQPNGNSFQMDNMTFSHNTVSVNGIKLHYVIGGHGDPVVLLHGWPETWYAWHNSNASISKELYCYCT